MKREDVLQQPVLREPDLQTVADAIEKRRYARVPVSVGVEIFDSKTRVRITGRATDLSVGGCYVDTMSTFAEGTSVDVFLQWQGRTLQLHALVSYAVNDRSIGMGLSFTGTSPEEGATLLDWVMEVGDPPEETAQRGAPNSTPAEETRSTQAHKLEEIVDELIGLLVHRQVLTETEGAELHGRLRPEGPNSPPK